jgi:hypothetical protein
MRGPEKANTFAPTAAGSGETHWSTYSFIVYRSRNRLKPERSKKLVFVDYCKRLIRKIKRVEYESKAFKWDAGEGEAEHV